MKTYDVKTDLECLDALLDIVENTKAGFIRNFEEMKSAVFSVIDTDKYSFLFIIDGYKDNPSDVSDAIIDNTLTNFYKMNSCAVYSDGIFYNPDFRYTGMFVGNALKNLAGERIKWTGNVSKEIVLKMSDYVKNYLVEKYPSLESIPDNLKDTALACDYTVETREAVLNDTDTENFNFKLAGDWNEFNERMYNNYQTAIAYHKACLDNKESDFIAEKAHEYLCSERVLWNINDTNEHEDVRTLAHFYCLRESVRKARENISKPVARFLEIKRTIEDFCKDAKKAPSKLRVTIEGKDSLLSADTKRVYPDFHIDGKDVIVKVDACDMTKLDGNKNFYNFYYNIKYESPMLKNNIVSSVDYLDYVSPFDILKVSYGKNVIYEAK